jgi:hypothetical protein
MTANPDSDGKVQIVHVLTMDVVQYLTLLITDQARVMSDLTSVVKNTEPLRSGGRLGPRSNPTLAARLRLIIVFLCQTFLVCAVATIKLVA